jgi:hypothetical protein
MLVYKGVAPGTHYDSTDPKVGGFTGDATQPSAFDDVVRHITAHSWPSAWVSVSMSFAVAADYATSGGKVYEVHLGRVLTTDITDPLTQLTAHADCTLYRFVHQHDGHQDLTPSVATPVSGAAILTAFPLRAGKPPTRRSPAPKVSTHLNALVFATRDAELLIATVPGRAVGNVYTVP